jgi:hypothetical protein
MNPDTERALARVLDRLGRPPRRRRGLSRAPVILALGFVLGYQLLVRLLPRVWGELLPGGLAGASRLRGLPGLAFAAARTCFYQFPLVAGTLAAIVVAVLLLSRGAWPFRLVAWLAALLVLAADAMILVVILRTALAATAAAAGMGVG